MISRNALQHTSLLCLSALVFATLGASKLHAITHIVTDESDFNALPTLNAGDVVILQSGNYGALDKTLNSSIGDDATAQSNPIRIYAEVAGTVNVTAPSKIYIEGRGIILAGLNFTSGSGMIDNASTSPASLIDLRPNSHYITLNNLKFDHCTTGDDYGHWIQVRGFNHTIEYCSFEGKDEPNENAIIAFKRNLSEPGDINTPRNHALRYCYFGPRECSETENGYEAIRIGDSSSQAYDMKVTIEHNVFYRAIWRTDGEKTNETEIISNKTKGNIIRYNTFLESFGQITLRHGDACTVEGNFTFGGGHYANDTIEIGSPNSYQGGVRIIGQNHIVQNNYFENLQGTGLRGALVLMAGLSDFDDGDGTYGDNTYEPANNALIANNTFIDCEEFNLGEVNNGSTQPTGVQIYNNAWQGDGTASDAIERNSNFTPAGSGGNYIYEPNSSDYGWTGLANSTYTDSTPPLITESYDHYRIPTSSSPLVGAANASLTAVKDIRSLTRPLSGQDTGSFERGLSGEEYGPLLRDEVGPLFDGGPRGTYPGNAYGLDPNLPPSDNFDLSKWYLTLPVDENGTFTGEAENVDTADLINDYTNAAWFVTGTDGAIVFTVPDNGAVRGSSSSPRNELRETLVDGSLHNWLPSDYGGSHTLDAVCTVNQLVDGVVVIGQIHAKVPNIPTVILRYDNRNGIDRIYLTIKETPTDPVTQDTLEFTPVSLGIPIDYQLKMEGTANSLVVSCTVNGETQSLDMYANSPDWLTATHYFKAGAYYTNPPASSSTEVSFYQLEVTHENIPLGPIASTATASADDGNGPENTLDNDLGTRWSANSDGIPGGQWIQFDMSDYYAVHELQIAWFNGNVRSTNFDVEISDDGINWRALATDQDTSGSTTQLEPVTIPVSHSRYLRIVGYGNTINGWNSITEVAINGLIAPAITPPELIAPTSAKSGNSMSLTFDSAYGRRYQLQYTTALSPSDWQNIGSVAIGTGSSMMLSDPDTSADTERFYRIEIKP